MLESFEKRKQDHIHFALDNQTQSRTATQFNRIRLIHEAMPEINLDQVDLSTKLLGHSFKSPHFVSSMTAGHGMSQQINLHLARAAQAKGWLMAVGSQRRELVDSLAVAEWKNIKKETPQTKFIANIGLEEVIKNPIEKVLKLIDSIEAIGIYVHLNPIQEAMQSYGDANFKNGLAAIKKLVQKSPVPVLVKEVGFGISKSTAQKLFSIGVEVVDVAGKGGTHWGILEGLRDRSENELLKTASLAFVDWGYSTVESLLQSKSLCKKHMFWASGGIRTGVDSLKCMALGARAVGIAQPLMKSAVTSDEMVLNTMTRLDYELQVAMFGVGVKNLKELTKKKVWYETTIG